MDNYKTIADKAAEWNVSPRHVQYLCKDGKIEGAIKRAGAWFIPDASPIPLKNTKSATINFKFLGTKKRIFEQAIRLFMISGFENVSVRDIANEVGIGQSAVYNHFKSKQDILDTIYDFYCYYFLLDRPSLEDLEPILLNGSLLDIIMCVRYVFDDEYKQDLADITKIVLQRSSTDERARKIHKSIMIDEGVNFVEDVFNRTVEIGRLAPLDTHAMAVFINGARLFTLHYWILDLPEESIIKAVEDEVVLYKYATTLLTDLKPTLDGPGI